MSAGYKYWGRQSQKLNIGKRYWLVPSVEGEQAEQGAAAPLAALNQTSYQLQSILVIEQSRSYFSTTCAVQCSCFDQMRLLLTYFDCRPTKGNRHGGQHLESRCLHRLKSQDHKHVLDEGSQLEYSFNHCSMLMGLRVQLQTAKP